MIQRTRSTTLAFSTFVILLSIPMWGVMATIHAPSLHDGQISRPGNNMQKSQINSVGDLNGLPFSKKSQLASSIEPHPTLPTSRSGQSIPAPLPSAHFDEQTAMTFSQSLTSIVYNVTASSQTDLNGYGPGDLVNGLTSTGYWYQAGLTFDWPYIVGGYTPGFNLLYAVFDPAQNVVLPTTGGGGIQSFNGLVSAGDTIQLSLSFNNGAVIMGANDLTTGSIASVNYSALGSSSFTGESSSIVNANGYFSGLMIEWWHADQFYDYQKKTTFSNTGFALSSARIWVDEFDSSNASWIGSFRENSTLLSYTSNPTQLQLFSSHGVYAASNAFGLVSGSIGCGPPGALSAGVLTCNGLGPTTISLTWGQSGYPFFGNYQVQQSTFGFSGPWTTIDTVSSKSNTTDYFRGLSPGRNYWWRYIDNAACCASATSNVFEITQPDVSTLSYEQITDTIYRFTWDNLGNYTGLEGFGSYQLMESVNGGTYSPAYSNNQVSGNSFGSQLSSDTSYSFYVITTDGCGQCSTEGLSSSVSNVVSLHTPLALVATVSINSVSIDVGQPVTFTCSGAGGVQPYTYSWSFGDGFTGTGGTADHTYNSQGTMSVQCSLRDSLQTTAPGALSLTVFPDPSVSTPSAIPQSIDAGQTVLLVAQSQGGSGGNTYAWSGVPPECTSSFGFISCSPTTTGTYLISLTVTDSNGFSATSARLSFTISSDPSVTSFKVSLSSLDINQSITFATSVSGGKPSFTYSYTGLPKGCVTVNEPTFTCTPTSMGSYSVKATLIDSNGFTVVSDLLPINVNSEPIASLTTSSSVVNVNQNFTLSVTTSGGTGPLVYSYSGLPPGCSSVDSNAIKCHSTRSGSYLVEVTVTDRTGEAVISSVRVDVNSDQLQQLGLPVLGGIAGSIAAIGVVGYLLVKRARTAKITAR